MKKAIVFGTGSYYNYVQNDIKNNYNIIAFTDNDENKIGTQIDGIEIIHPKKINQYSFDEIIIASQYKVEIVNQLLKDGITIDKVKIEIDDRIKTTVNSRGAILYDIDGIKLYAKTVCDIMTIHEIYKGNIYGFQPGNKEIAVVDIGMNVANATLYFARNNNVKKVYGFEPFRYTYNEALENIKINDKSIIEKIETYNIALGNYNEKIKAENNINFSGGNSILFEANKISQNVVEIEVRKANELIEPILKENEYRYIVFKIDCEGSEYSIFESLEENNLTEKIDLILMEWHKCKYGNFEKLKKYLQEKNFTVILNTPNNYVSFLENQNIGMLYAFNNKCSTFSGEK